MPKFDTKKAPLNLCKACAQPTLAPTHRLLSNPMMVSASDQYDKMLLALPSRTRRTPASSLWWKGPKYQPQPFNSLYLRIPLPPRNVDSACPLRTDRWAGYPRIMAAHFSPRVRFPECRLHHQGVEDKLVSWPSVYCPVSTAMRLARTNTYSRHQSRW